MKGFSVSAAAFLVAASAVDANEPTVPGVLHLPLTRRNDVPNLARRASESDSASLQNNFTLGAYLTTVSVGTPPQQLTLQVDTGSSDTWVPSVNAAICKSGNCTYGSFDESKSSTFQVHAKGAFNISYGDGSSSTGDYIEDKFAIGSSSLTDLILGFANETDIPYGLVGVGYSNNEATSDVYTNLPLQLVNLSVVASPAYSLYLNDLQASSGDILFGGVDTAKYQGTLTRVNVLEDPASGIIDRFLVVVNSISATSSSGTDQFGSKNFPFLALLDSGTTLTLLPSDIVKQIWAEVGIYTTDSQGTGYVPCDYSNGQGTITYGLGGPDGASIRVGLNELVIPGAVDTFSDGAFKGKEACAFGITPLGEETGGLFAILGDTFLRSAYVVYDLANNQIGLGQTIFNSTQSNIVAFASSSAAIPSSTPAPSQGTDQLGIGAVTATLSSFAAQASFAKASNTSSSSSSSPAGRVVVVGGGVWLPVGVMLAAVGSLLV